MRITNDLEDELRLAEKKKEALLILLHSGKISQDTFDLMEKRTNRLTSVIADLKEILKEEETFWRSNRSKETRILESLLIEFKLRYLLGEIGEEEWKQKSDIINLGLNSLKDYETLFDKIYSKPVLPIQITDENIFREVRTRLEKESKRELPEILPEKGENLKMRETVRNKYSKSKPKRGFKKEPSTLDNPSTHEVRCMNPWNKKCRNTDIELSIYYNGQLTPICHECWEEISKKNIEWSGL